MSVYVALTREFNEGALRAILSSGQAVVLHHGVVAARAEDVLPFEPPEEPGDHSA